MIEERNMNKAASKLLFFAGWITISYLNILKFELVVYEGWIRIQKYNSQGKKFLDFQFLQADFRHMQFGSRFGKYSWTIDYIQVWVGMLL